jgi:hypothetical protein
VKTPFGDFAPIVNMDRSFYKSLARSAQDARGRLTKWQGAMERVNKDALRYIQDEAADVLQDRIERTGRPQDHNSGRLMRAIRDDRFHQANKYRIRFMIDEKVRPFVPYYGAIEFGSDYWPTSGRMLPFAFLGGPFDAKSGKFAGRTSGSHMVGPREYRNRGLTAPRTMIRIRRPVPAYQYGTIAGERLISSGHFDDLILRHLGPPTEQMGANLVRR